MLFRSSTAHAKGMASSHLPPQASAAASTSAGRMRLPPANIEYRMALCSVAGRVDGRGRRRPSAASTVLEADASHGSS